MKLLLFRRRTLAVLACLLAATAMFTAVQYPAAVSAAATQRQLPIYCVQRDQKWSPSPLTRPGVMIESGPRSATAPGTASFSRPTADNRGHPLHSSCSGW